MRLTPDERSARLRSRLLEALARCGGWLPRSALRLLAGQGEVYADELDEALGQLEAEGRVQSRAVHHFVGRHGSATRVYRATGYAVLAGDVRKDGAMPSLDLAPADKVRLLDAVHSQLVVSRARDDAEAAAAWLRISATLLVGELFGDDPDVDASEPGADEATGP